MQAYTIHGILLGAVIGVAIGIGVYTFKLRNMAMDALVDLIKDLKAATEAGKTDSELVRAQDFQRRAQFYLDFVEAENSTGFHAPPEAARILGESIDFSRKGQKALHDGR